MRLATLKSSIVMSFFLLIAAYTAVGKVIYVDADAQGPVYDGSSWTTAFEYLQEALTILPRTIRRSGRSRRVLAVMRLPESIGEEDIDLSEPLVLFPGGIEADEQKLLPDKTADDSVRIRAVFDRAELLAVTPDNGDVEVTVAGRFISGLCFYDTDTVKIK